MTDRDRETLAARADFATTQKELAKLQLEHRAVEAEVERLRAALDDVRNHVCLPSEPSAVSMRRLADRALKGEREEPPRRRLILGVADQLADDSEDLERP